MRKETSIHMLPSLLMEEDGSEWHNLILNGFTNNGIDDRRPTPPLLNILSIILIKELTTGFTLSFLSLVYSNSLPDSVIPPSSDLENYNLLNWNSP